MQQSVFDRGLRRISSLFLVFSVMFSSISIMAFAQDTNKDKQKRKQSTESLKSVYKRWVDEDVRWIITDEERKTFMSLKTDDEREQFIEQFWLRRDPDPDTDVNEYREDYYQRIAYANEKYTSGIPGWKTDRGRMYIMFGKPDQVESHPSGGHTIARRGKAAEIPRHIPLRSGGTGILKGWDRISKSSSSIRQDRESIALRAIRMRRMRCFILRMQV
ncbi:MAG: GWxTD domain-containing protein [Acidobacteria bacterium]|nr:GWxTD domain-containing protein [Acidobacteriota bacterium]